MGIESPFPTVEKLQHGSPQSAIDSFLFSATFCSEIERPDVLRLEANQNLIHYIAYFEVDAETASNGVEYDL